MAAGKVPRFTAFMRPALFIVCIGAVAISYHTLTTSSSRTSQFTEVWKKLKAAQQKMVDKWMTDVEPRLVQFYILNPSLIFLHHNISSSGYRDFMI